jgi:UDP-glucose 6-dehydrogenase
MALPKDNVTVLGIGRLGICTALVLEQQGKYNVVGVDTNESYVKAIQDKTFRTTEPMVNEYLARSTNFKATTDLDEGLRHSDTCEPPPRSSACFAELWLIFVLQLPHICSHALHWRQKAL